MSEKIFALLLRLFPPEFRARYGDEARQLYRDRARDERGVWRQVRLGLDLLLDLIVSLPRAWEMSYSITGVQADAHLVPSFRLLYREPLRPSSILLGGMLSMTILGSSVLVLRYAALHPRGFERPSPIDSVLQRINRPMTSEAGGSDGGNALAESAGAAKTPRARERTKAIAASDASAPLAREKTNAVPQSARGVSSQFIPVPAQGLRSGSRLSKRAEFASNANPVVNATVSLPVASGVHSSQAVPPSPGPANSGGSQSPAGPQIAEDATAAMIQAITTHQVVMFGETHANKQEYAWLCALVKTPAFADRADNIVVEFGNSLYQQTVDRYIAGEDVPEEQIEKAWRNVIGAVGPVSPVYGEFYAAVRASNLARRGKHPIRLVLGDPYGDWEKIKNAEDLGPYLGHREEWYAQVVKDEVLAKHHRALLIMGAGHFLRRNGPGLVERAIRAEGVTPYLVVLGTNAVRGFDDLDPRFDAWRAPAIVALKDTWAGALPAMPVMTGGEVAPNALKMSDVADALLYVGPRDALTQVNVPREKLDGTAYGAEVNRRLMIQTGRTMEFDGPPEEPQYRKPVQQTVSNGIHRLPPSPPKSANDPLPPRPPSQ